ncbi:unnamed protein product [Pleuronectes platessa]|uniref:Uncharacterized protein n=1 Tax=Pleuronectes platessa TaxID=8262 RepID=A0A9N7UW23_PLEPL|nr:unnamed protein product [Pleuronectes platessa]
MRMELTLTTPHTLTPLSTSCQDFSVVWSRASAAVMFRNSLKMLLTGGKANRKSRSSDKNHTVELSCSRAAPPDL